MTMSVTLPLVAGSEEMADKALEFSKIENTMRGELERRDRSVDDLTMSTKAYAAAQPDAAAESAYAGVGGLPEGPVNVKEHQGSVLAAVKAGCQDTATNDPAKRGERVSTRSLAQFATGLLPRWCSYAIRPLRCLQPGNETNVFTTRDRRSISR